MPCCAALSEVLHTTDMKQPKYRPLARFCGNVEWVCPYCGANNKSRLEYSGWKFECKGKYCSKRYHLGLMLFVHTRQNSGGRPPGRPFDYVIPRRTDLLDPFPPCELEKWQRSKPSHRLVW